MSDQGPNSGPILGLSVPKKSLRSHSAEDHNNISFERRWFVTWQTPSLLSPQAAGQTSSCFASRCILEMKSHIFSRHAGMARPHYSTRRSIRSPARCTVMSPHCWERTGKTPSSSQRRPRRADSLLCHRLRCLRDSKCCVEV